MLDELPQIFARNGNERAKGEDALIATFYQEIGQLKVELDFLKKSGLSVEQKQLLIEPEHPHLSMGAASFFA